MIFKNLKQYNLSEERFQECDALEEQINLKNEINKCKKSTKTPQKRKKHRLFKTQKRLLKGRQKVLNGFEGKIFPIGKQTQGKERSLELAKQLKKITPKQMIQRLPIALMQVKAGNTAENI